MREIGRLRELSFRAVGEGTGRKRDIDKYDSYYMHLILWDEDDLEIVGRTGYATPTKYLPAPVWTAYTRPLCFNTTGR